MGVGDGDRGSLGFLFFSVVILSLFIWARFPPLPAGCVWEQVGRIRAKCVYMDLSRAALSQVCTALCYMVSHRPRSPLLLITCRRRVGEDRMMRKMQRKTIQEYLALSDCK